jgi:hypothetical protein
MTLGQFYKFGANKSCCSQWRTGLSGALAGAPPNWLLSGFLSARPLKIIGLSGVPSDCPVRQLATINFTQWSTLRLRVQFAAPEVRRQSATTGHIGLSGVPPDYLMQQKTSRLQRSTAPNPNGRQTWHT